MWVTKTEGLDDTRGSANHREGTSFSVRVVGPACTCAVAAKIDKNKSKQQTAVDANKSMEPTRSIEGYTGLVRQNP